MSSPRRKRDLRAPRSPQFVGAPNRPQAPAVDRFDCRPKRYSIILSRWQSVLMQRLSIQGSCFSRRGVETQIDGHLDLVTAILARLAAGVDTKSNNFMFDSASA